MKNVAVILSGGTGSRFGGSLPKQFVKLAGKAVIEYTVDQFETAKEIDEIVVVSKPQYIDHIWAIINKNSWKKITRVVAGGSERFDSTESAIKSLTGYDEETNVILHDAVRPLITHKIIQDCIDRLALFKAVDVVIPSADTLVETLDDGCIAQIPNRSHMRRGQTPQAFKLGVISEAYEEANRQNRKVFTCDCGVVRAMLPHIRVATVEGAERNIKITQPIDLYLAEKLLQTSDRANIDDRLDLNELANKVIVVIGGGSGIGRSMYDLALVKKAKVYSASRSLNGVDVTKPETIEEFLEKVEKIEGKIDAVVNTTGLLIKKPIDTLELSEINNLIDINYRGVVNTAIVAKKYLAKTKGMLLNFTSSSYTRGRAYYALYSSTKSAVVNFTQALAEEWAASDIRVNCVNPERTSTPMRTTNFGVEDPESLLTAEDVAKTSLATLLNHRTGIVVDVRKDGR